MSVLAARTVTFARRAWAFGLTWSTGQAGSLAREARRAAGTGAVAIRHAHDQYATGPKEVRGAAVAAAAAAASTPGVWWAVWELDDDVWWGVAVSGGSVLPGVGDQVMQGQDTVRTWIAELNESGAVWQHRLGPDWLEDERTAAAPPLEGVLERGRRGRLTLRRPGLMGLGLPARKSPGPQPDTTPSASGPAQDNIPNPRDSDAVAADRARERVSPPGPVSAGLPRFLARFSLVVLATALLAGAGLAIYRWLEPPPKPVAQAPAPIVEEVPPLEPLPVPDAARVDQVLNGCAHLFAHIMTPPRVGWTLGQGTCSLAGPGLAASLDTVAARVPIALFATRTDDFGDPISLSSRSASRSVTLPVALSAPAPAPAEDILWTLSAIRDALGGAAEISTTVTDPPFDPEQNLPPQWRRLEWTFSTQLPLTVWQGALERTPGLLGETVTYTFGGVWTIGGWARIDRPSDRDPDKGGPHGS